VTSRERFDSSAVLEQLRPFQRHTVDHVFDRFYGDDPTTRFLVADETGLGKSIVARGVIARAIERLQDDPTVGRIDVIYVCSNQDLARQNLQRLNVTGARDLQAGGRLSLLATTANGLTRDDGAWSKPVKLVSFTPQTSFDSGSGGNVEERLLILQVLQEQLGLDSAADWRAAYSVFQAGVASWQNMREHHHRYRERWGELDAAIVTEVRAVAATPGADGSPSLVDHFGELVDEYGERTPLIEQAWRAAADGFRRGRSILSLAGIKILEPDLVILDEFQRFKDLLNASSPSGELAHQLYDQSTARVLLLSATPYKPYTLAEEHQQDEHRSDLLATLTFLAKGRADSSIDHITAELSAFRDAVINAQDASQHSDVLRTELLTMMCRAERPDSVQHARLRERIHDVEDVTVDDLVAFARLTQIADLVDGSIPVEYWKSAPYFANFMDGYQVRRQIDDELQLPGGAGLRERLAAVQQLPRDAIESHQAIDLANGKLRQLARQTVEVGWEQLLWVPPTLPYLTPGGPFRYIRNMTKKLVFSSWMATPTAVASLLSYEAERRIVDSGRRDKDGYRRSEVRARLLYRLDQGLPAGMSTLALFWPMPRLAKLGDPLGRARSFGHPADPELTVNIVQRVIAERYEDPQQVSRASEVDSWYWRVAFDSAGSMPLNVRRQAAGIAARLFGTGGSEGDVAHGSSGARRHVDALADLAVGDGNRPEDLATTVAHLACFSPANSAWRALDRIARGNPSITESGVWLAAVTLANGLRSLFNRPESIQLLDGLYPDAGPYWRAVLQYCADGNLQAVLDEYVYQLTAEAPGELDDAGLDQLAQEAVAAMSLRKTNYRAFDPSDPDTHLNLGASFALRYGSRAGTSGEGSMRPSDVRKAFNSPFWPFVLVSTSVGQEGIDFHHWSHSLVHWNVPANPVDFEQREGRVDRFRGHAVRKNIAQALGQQIFRSPTEHPWDAAYRLAGEARDQLDGLSPDWLFDGPAKIERTLFQFPLSRDVAALQQIKRDLAHYRLAFGQSRQEDFLALLQEHAPGQLIHRIELIAPPGGNPDIDLLPKGDSVASARRPAQVSALG